MTFVQIEFVWLFALVFALYWAMGRRRWQNLLLAVVSFVFYGWVHPWFCILLAASSVLDYNVALWIRRWPDRKNWLLAVSMVGNLGMLGYFKYANFFLDNFATVLGALGFEAHPTTLQVLLPVGISFYTFQTMSYTIDVYRGQLEPRRDFIDYIVFVSMFPQLVAGPVERASNMLPQIERDRVFRWNAVTSGLGLALWGAVKKMVVADTIAPYVDTVFLHNDPSGLMVAAATLGFAIQILADFSGYTDIARGVARMLGFELMLNFDNPYIATNPSDFWRRWHISFSSWIRDYLYIPLGGSRGGKLNTHKATFGAMLLSGLWHGASWTFVLWGAYHATLITIYRWARPTIPRSFRDSRLGHALAVALMFVLTCGGWLIFRETHIDRLVMYLTDIPLVGTTDHLVAAAVMFAISLATGSVLVAGLVMDKLVIPRIRHTPWMVTFRAGAWAAYALAIFTFTRVTVSDFIYFAF